MPRREQVRLQTRTRHEEELVPGTERRLAPLLNMSGMSGAAPQSTCTQTSSIPVSPEASIVFTVAMNCPGRS